MNENYKNMNEKFKVFDQKFNINFGSWSFGA